MLDPKAVRGAAARQTVETLQYDEVEVVLLALSVEQRLKVLALARQRSGHAVEDDLINEDHAHPISVLAQERQLGCRRGRPLRRIARADKADVPLAFCFLSIHFCCLRGPSADGRVPSAAHRSPL